MSPKPQGSLDGAAFYVSSHDTEIGRRGPVTALPFQEKGAAGADVGRLPRKITVNAFVLGDEHVADLQKVVTVIERPGPHLLVHPKIGRMNVWIRTARLGQSTAEGRKATITFTAEEAFDQPRVTPLFDASSAVVHAKTTGIAKASKSFANPITGLRHATSDFVAAAHLDVLDSTLQSMRTINQSISAVLSVPSGFAAQIDALSREGAELVRTPQRMFNEIEGTLALLASAAGRFSRDGEDKQIETVDALVLPLRPGRNLTRTAAVIADMGDMPEVPRVNTSERVEQAAGQLAIQRHMRAAGLLHWAAAAAETAFDSAEDARQARDAIVGHLVDLSESEPPLDPELAMALRNAAGALSTQLTAAAAALPAVAVHRGEAVIPCEVLAYRLYGDHTRADEIVLRNLRTVRHPSFLPAHVDLEVRKT